MKKTKFDTEAAMCASFIKWAEKQGWKSYAETEGWDILLVAVDGTQIGIQAKLRFNMKVLQQAVENGLWGNETGPDFRAVLVPDSGGQDICAALGMTMIYCGGVMRDYFEFFPRLPTSSVFCANDWHWLNPTKRHPVPAYMPDVIAGASAPIQLTQWKVGALKITALLDVRGYVTRTDFKMMKIDHRRWVNDSKWLVPTGQPGQYARGPELRFDQQHPQVYAQIRAEVEKQQKSTELPVVEGVA